MRDIDGVISGYLSMSYAAPHLFADRLGAFIDEMRRFVSTRSPAGEFWDWPGDTEIVVARRPRMSV